MDTVVVSFSERIHRRGCSLLVHLGNLLNAEVCATTFVELLLSIEETKAIWVKRKTAMGWTIDSVGQSDMETLEFQ